MTLVFLLRYTKEILRRYLKGILRSYTGVILYTILTKDNKVIPGILISIHILQLNSTFISK